MKVLGFIILHYGKDFLSEAIRSIHSHCDKVIILYSEKPSWGRDTQAVCPDRKEDLKQQAINTSSKVIWVDVNPSTEGEHTGLIYNYSEGYDLILRVDSDEIFDQSDLERALKQAHNSNERNYLINGFVNFYRSFNEICLDSFQPVRIIKPSGIANTNKTLNCTVYHGGYSQREEIIKYKWSNLHAHFQELRTNWLEDKFLNYKAGETKDVHPTSFGIWNPQPFDKTTLPEDLRAHPYYLVDKIV